MRRSLLVFLVVLAMTSGCGKSEDHPTPEQAAQLDMLRQAAIKQIETMFGRSLTEDEKQCVVAKLENGKLSSFVSPPLSETIKRWHSDAQTKPSS